MSMDAAIRFRTAERADTPLILRFIRELAAYEQLRDQVVADESTLEEWLFDRKKAEPMSDWTVYRIAGDTLTRLAEPMSGE